MNIMDASIRRDALIGRSIALPFQRQFLWPALLLVLFAAISAASVLYSKEAAWTLLVPLIVIGAIAALDRKSVV